LLQEIVPITADWRSGEPHRINLHLYVKRHPNEMRHGM